MKHTHTHCREVFEMWAPCFAHLLCSLAWKRGLSGDAFNFHSYWIMNTTVISLKDSDFAAKMLQLFNNSIWLNACFLFLCLFWRWQTVTQTLLRNSWPGTHNSWLSSCPRLSDTHTTYSSLSPDCCAICRHWCMRNLVCLHIHTHKGSVCLDSERQVPLARDKVDHSSSGAQIAQVWSPDAWTRALFEMSSCPVSTCYLLSWKEFTPKKCRAFNGFLC